MAFGSSFMGKGSKSEKKLSNRSYYKSMIDNNQDSAFLADIDGDVLLVNNKAIDYTGYSEDQLINIKLREIFVTLSGEANPLDAELIREFEKELYLIKSSSYIIPVLLQLTEIEGGKFLGIIKQPEVVENITPQANINHTNTPTQDNNTANQPSNNVVTIGLSSDEEHAARNSLNTILGFSNILSKEEIFTNNRKLLGYIKSIITNSNKLKDILKFSDNSLADNSDASLSKCILSSIIQKAQILLQAKADQNNIEIVIDMPTEFNVLSDENVLFTTTSFLLEKAITFCRSMFIDIKVRPSDIDGKLLLVIDNIGQDIPMGIKSFIEDEYMKPSYDINNPIISSDSEITALLKNLNSINSKIKFETSDDLGDIIMIELPIYLDTASNNNTLREQGSQNAIKKKALIIEDDKLNAIILKNHLQQFVDTTTAFSGNEALNIIEMLNSKGVVFDIVFTDIGLPAPWDGISLKQEIAKRWPQYANVPFVAQTGYSAKSYSDKIRNAGFTGYLIKPINRNDVKKFVNNL